jgi:hypothetical protein
MVATKTPSGVKREGKAATKKSNGRGNSAADFSGIVFVTRRQGRQMLDRQARKHFNMTGDEFARRYRAGEIEDPDRSEVITTAMLIPFAKIRNISITRAAMKSAPSKRS